MKFPAILKSKASPAPPHTFIFQSFIGTATAIGITGWLSVVSGAPWLMAPFGASCALAFGMPDSPLAQPRSIIGGHVLSAAVGLLMLYFLGNAWWVGALAVAVALGLMQHTRTLHAPAGGNPLVVLAASTTPMQLLLTPVLTGSVVIVAVAWCLNNTRRKGSYPQYWI